MKKFQGLMLAAIFIIMIFSACGVKTPVFLEDTGASGIAGYSENDNGR